MATPCEVAKSPASLWEEMIYSMLIGIFYWPSSFLFPFSSAELKDAAAANVMTNLSGVQQSHKCGDLSLRGELSQRICTGFILFIHIPLPGWTAMFNKKEPTAHWHVCMWLAVWSIINNSLNYWEENGTMQTKNPRSTGILSKKKPRHCTQMMLW